MHSFIHHIIQKRSLDLCQIRNLCTKWYACWYASSHLNNYSHLSLYQVMGLGNVICQCVYTLCSYYGGPNLNALPVTCGPIFKLLHLPFTVIVIQIASLSSPLLTMSVSQLLCLRRRFSGAESPHDRNTSDWSRYIFWWLRGCYSRYIPT